MHDDVVDVTTMGSTLVVTLQRPEARNAINQKVADALAAAMNRLDGDDHLRVGVLTGAAGTFCAGMDLKAFVAGEDAVVPGRGFAGLVERPPDKPLIAAVEGYALAGGFELVLACDLVVAARGAAFGLPEVRRGLVAAGGGLLRLPQRVGLHHAMELALTGRHVGAEEAERLGLINRLVDDGQALAASLELADQIAANGPLAVKASRQILCQCRDWPVSEAFTRQEHLAGPVARSRDAIEGATAFAQKRRPVWEGR